MRRSLDSQRIQARPNSGFQRLGKLSRTALFFTLTSGCAPYMKSARECFKQQSEMVKADESIVDPQTLPERVEFLSVDGDPKVGTVVHFRQTHSSPLETVESEKEAFNLVTGYQRRILEELIELKPDVIISETVRSDISEDELKEASSRQEKLIVEPRYENLSPEGQEFFRFARKVIDKGFDSLNEEENTMLNEILYYDGAGVFYLSASPGMTFIPSGTKDKAEETIGMFKDPKKFDLDKLKELQNRREDELVRQVMSYLDKEPGKTIAVTYGALHNFCDNFNKLDNPPVIKSVLYPRLTKLNRKDMVTIMQTCNDEGFQF